MIRPDVLRQRLKQRPFEPFQVRTADGRTFDIRYPDINMVTPVTFVIGILLPSDTDPEPIPDQLERVELRDIVELVPLPADKVPTGS